MYRQLQTSKKICNSFTWRTSLSSRIKLGDRCYWFIFPVGKLRRRAFVQTQHAWGPSWSLCRAAWLHRQSPTPPRPTSPRRHGDPHRQGCVVTSQTHYWWWSFLQHPPRVLTPCTLSRILREQSPDLRVANDTGNWIWLTHEWTGHCRCQGEAGPGLPALPLLLLLLTLLGQRWVLGGHPWTWVWEDQTLCRCEHQQPGHSLKQATAATAEHMSGKWPWKPLVFWGQRLTAWLGEIWQLFGEPLGKCLSSPPITGSKSQQNLTCHSPLGMCTENRKLFWENLLIRHRMLAFLCSFFPETTCPGKGICGNRHAQCTGWWKAIHFV